MKYCEAFHLQTKKVKKGVWLASSLLPKTEVKRTNLLQIQMSP